MKRLLFIMAALAALALAPLNALAATYIQDNGNMFSANAKNQATQQIDQLVQRTGKSLLVYTVPSLNGQDASAAADAIFRQNNVNGVLFYMSNQDRRLEIKIDDATRRTITTSRETQIRDTILGDFRAGNMDKGLLDGVSLVRSSLIGAAGSTATGAPVRSTGPNWLFIGMLIVIGLIVVWIISGIMRARQQPYFSYGQNPQQPGYGAPGYGQPGYGPGFGGGGGFFSGLMGGIGGALLGNALFNAFRPRDQFYDNPGGGYDGGFRDVNDTPGQVTDNPADSGSWGDSGSSGGDWSGGDSGGGGDPGGGSW